jgi:hypothetical protein
MNTEQNNISAQVVLLPADGRSMRHRPPPTAANIGEYQPSPAAAEAAVRIFQRAGFDTGLLVGVSFSIAAPARRFEEFFGTKLGQMEGYELPLAALSNELRGIVDAVTFTPPPSFGPTSWST